MDKKLIGSKKTEKYTIKDFTVLDDVLKNFAVLWTAPYVLTEVSNLANISFYEKRKKEFFGYFSAFINSQSFREEYLSAKDIICMREFFEFGITDAALLKIMSIKNLLLMTDDFPLAQYAHKAQMDVINFNHIRNQYITK